MKNRKILLSALWVLACIFAHGQTTSLQLVGSAGESTRNSSYQIDWSVGELLTETYNSNVNQITQGFHQGKYIITAINPIRDLQLEISVFPNPATDFIIVKIESDKVGNYQFNLTDLIGKTLQKSKLPNDLQQIDLNGLAAGTYLLNIQSAKTLVKTFKIVKSN